MNRPLIGLTMDSGDRPDRYELHSAYPASVELAGGIPIPIPYRTGSALIPQILNLLNGICFIGGNDLDPALYGEQWHPQAIPVDKERQDFELALLAEVERRRLPALGVCMGSQLMNVYRGGTLHQFLPDIGRADAIEHRKLDRQSPAHAIHVDPESNIGRAIGKTRIEANTYHKQAANRIGRGLRVVATAPDGVIEGFEDPEFPLFAGVQWHPERLSDRAEHLALFRLLVDKSRGA